jgi:hypothetical protein
LSRNEFAPDAVVRATTDAVATRAQAINTLEGTRINCACEIRWMRHGTLTGTLPVPVLAIAKHRDAVGDLLRFANTVARAGSVLPEVCSSLMTTRPPSATRAPEATAMRVDLPAPFSPTG